MGRQRRGGKKNASGGSHALPLVVPTQQNPRKMSAQVRAHITDGPPGHGRSHCLVTPAPDTPKGVTGTVLRRTVRPRPAGDTGPTVAHPCRLSYISAVKTGKQL